jgi:hypothetical protein
MISGVSTAEQPRGSRPERPRGLVVFPIESLAPTTARPSGRLGWLRDWWIVFAAMVFAAAVVGVALLVR